MDPTRQTHPGSPTASSPGFEPAPTAPRSLTPIPLAPARRRCIPNPTAMKAAYAKSCRPKLADLLNTFQLDVTYERGAGSYLYLRNGAGEMLAPVLDLVSGFGACLLGHNPPELKQALHEQLDRDTPTFAPGSIRGAAGQLATLLNERHCAPGHYLCHFTNSGAEALQTALQHAYQVRRDAVQQLHDHTMRELDELCARIEEEGLEVTWSGQPRPLSQFHDVLAEHNTAQLDRFRRDPVAIAVTGSTPARANTGLACGGSQRTGDDDLAAVELVRVDPSDVARLPELVERHRVEFLVPRLEGRCLRIERHPMTRVIALVCAVVVAQRGNRELPVTATETLAALHGRLGVPFIIDEIQTGCGRTGAVFASTQTALASIEPEYVVLGEGLGGGLVKMGAAMIHERVYHPAFDALLTSPLAEDDVSCAVASQVLKLLGDDDSALLRQVRDKGEYLVTRLRELQARHPGVIARVHGQGLLIGLELGQLPDRSPFIRHVAGRGLLSLLMASYLLHHHRIRVLGPLPSQLEGSSVRKSVSVLPLYPPAIVTKAETDRIIFALDEVCEIIDKNNEYLLVAHLIGERIGRADRCSPRPFPSPSPSEQHRSIDSGRGLMSQPLTLSQLVEGYFPSFASYSWNPQRLAQWWTSLARILEPDAQERAPDVMRSLDLLL